MAVGNNWTVGPAGETPDRQPRCRVEKVPDPLLQVDGLPGEIGRVVRLEGTRGEHRT